jgi:HAD superfamily hydrolase (TIGR01662 family)
MEVLMVLGCPASGKTKYSKDFIAKTGAVHLNRDAAGGTVSDLVLPFTAALKAGKSVVLDNLYTKAEDRKPFLEAAKKAGVSVKCIWVTTSIEDAQINALNRCFHKHGKVLQHADEMKGLNDPNTFPVAVLFVYRKNFEKPDKTEGFSTIEKVEFVRNYDPAYTNSAIIFDYDGTLRDVPTSAKFKFPSKVEEVEILAGRKQKLASVVKKYDHILGISNQSGIAKKQVTREAAIACFEKTNELLGQKIDYAFCPHSVPPITCYCRKPQSGLGVHFIHKYKLDPKKCLMVGDLGSDASFAKRLGINFANSDDFFAK